MRTFHRPPLSGKLYHYLLQSLTLRAVIAICVCIGWAVLCLTISYGLTADVDRS